MPELKEKWMAKVKEIGLLRISLLLISGFILVLTSFLGTTTTKKSNNTQGEVETVVKEYQTTYKEQMEEEISKALEKVEGIGKAEVMITLKSSKEIVVNKDAPIQEEKTKEEDSQGGTREESSYSKQETTVLVTDSSGQSVPYVIKELEPEIEGIVVVAEGADREMIIQEITDACEVLFSVPVHKIKVMKMKHS